MRFSFKIINDLIINDFYLTLQRFDNKLQAKWMGMQWTCLTHKGFTGESLSQESSRNDARKLSWGDSVSTGRILCDKLRWMGTLSRCSSKSKCSSSDKQIIGRAFMESQFSEWNHHKIQIWIKNSIWSNRWNELSERIHSIWRLLLMYFDGEKSKWNNVINSFCL